MAKIKTVSIPDDLFNRVQAQAEADGIAFNKEVTELLRFAIEIKEQEGKSTFDVVKKIVNNSKEIAQLAKGFLHKDKE